MLFPKKVKYRKRQTRRRNPKKKFVESRGLTLAFGSWGLKALAPARVRSNQLEAARKTISREIKKSGKLWIRVFPDWPYTAKPAEVKLGKGKGDVVGYQTQVKPGRIILEIDGLADELSRDVLRRAAAKLPVKTKIVSRQ